MNIGDYEVGRGKPPVHTRFQKGRSGNPSGRKKRMPTIEDLLIRELEQTIVITGPGGRRQRITMQHAMIKTLVRDAVKGDKQALKIIAEILTQAALHRDQQARGPIVIELDMTGELAASGHPDFQHQD